MANRTEQFKSSIPGRLHNTHVAPWDVLLPVFESIMNSMQGIEDTNSNGGLIKINLIRGQSDELELESGAKDPIRSVEIIDDGIGFNDKNFDSFVTTDSPYKLSKGGKGLGRFSWLKVFEEVKVESTYDQLTDRRRRTFYFRPADPGIFEEEETSVGSKAPLSTKVTLLRIRVGYNLPKKVQTIAEKIFGHFLLRFLDPRCPQVVVSDGVDSLTVNSLMAKVPVVDKEFELNGCAFNVKIIRLAAGGGSHDAVLCANYRAVTHKALKELVPSLPDGRIIANHGQEDYYCAVAVTGSLFDERVNDSRTDLLIPNEPGELYKDEITKDAIWTEVKAIVNEELSADLVDLKTQRDTHVADFIQRQYPEFRPLLADQYNARMESIPYPISDSRLVIELNKFKYEIDVQTREEAKRVLEASDDDPRSEEFAKKATALLDKVTEWNQAELTKYVINRKLLLNLLNKKLSFKSPTDENYELEAAVHQVIFPLRTKGDTIDYNQHNLWIIDERLVYHKYLTSDIRFHKMTAIDSESADRPDTIIFDVGQSALVDEDQGPYKSVVILEFKKPMRTAYDDSENPISQVLRYIEDFKAGKVTTPNGRQISLTGSSIPFYCYIVCDITPKIIRFAQESGLSRTPDQQGFFGFKGDPYNAYVEILSYSKMLRDAHLRNRVFFSKLGIEASV